MNDLKSFQCRYCSSVNFILYFCIFWASKYKTLRCFWKITTLIFCILTSDFSGWNIKENKINLRFCATISHCQYTINGLIIIDVPKRWSHKIYTKISMNLWHVSTDLIRLSIWHLISHLYLYKSHITFETLFTLNYLWPQRDGWIAVLRFLFELRHSVIQKVVLEICLKFNIIILPTLVWFERW